MTPEGIIEVLEHEKECVVRNVNKECNRDCSKCDLVLPDADIINAYDYALTELKELSEALNFQQSSNMSRYFEVKELKQELELYKKALELACYDHYDITEIDAMELMNKYIHEARECL